MVWRAFEVVLRLRSPMHIGCGKVGNLQRTRPYVTGRVVWGALTMRLTRATAQGREGAADSRKYKEIGEQVHQHLAFTYFYPALKSGADYRVAWPWENESTFRRRFLSSYQGTALAYPQQSAAEGLLHEVEFVSPHTLDTGEAVFLKGYVFEKESCGLDWQSAFRLLQVGGERGYGWGDVALVRASQLDATTLFGGVATFTGDGDRPHVRLSAHQRLLAHTVASGLHAAGDIEPLVGREWRSDNPRRQYVGQSVVFCDICFTPGSVALQTLEYEVGTYGIWRARMNKD